MSASTRTGTDGVMVEGSTEYTAVAQFRAAATPRDCRVYLVWYDADGAEILPPTDGIAVTNSTSAWTDATVTGTSPADAVYVAVVVAVEDASAAEVHYVDKIGLFLRNSDPLWDPGVDDSGAGGMTFDAPVASLSGDDNAEGVSLDAARSDHVHDRNDDAALFWMSIP